MDKLHELAVTLAARLKSVELVGDPADIAAIHDARAMIAEEAEARYPLEAPQDTGGAMSEVDRLSNIERGARGLHQRDVDDPVCEPDRREWDHLTVALQDHYRADAKAVLDAANPQEAVRRLERAETLLRELCHREGNPRAVKRTMDDVRELVDLPRLGGSS